MRAALGVEKVTGLPIGFEPNDASQFSFSDYSLWIEPLFGHVGRTDDDGRDLRRGMPKNVADAKHGRP